MTTQYNVANTNLDAIKNNQGKDATFDFDAVKSLDFQSVVKSKLYQDQLYVLGGIAVPDVKLNLPIFKGVSNYSLIVGAGTMKPEQKMGEGNYALASHHMLEADLLFGPLTKVELGQVIYLTDLEYIYEYEIDYKEYVEPTRVDLIEDQPDKTQLTLVTCDETGNQRLIVQATFKEKVSNKKASKKMIKAFNLDKNTY
ncbi:class A sortase [Vagococcus coleopterorum]|uniref:Class A sortase n=1 Tax=Vagococcus coleopterorum TaxID=2714946 RepID=A0A6G8AM41_9ENTE|nr:class A sortase [Vagococcus coleopterorum]QIL46128.1 class A sortase [Vagococcus coleopterorum]